MTLAHIAQAQNQVATVMEPSNRMPRLDSIYSEVPNKPDPAAWLDQAAVKLRACNWPRNQLVGSRCCAPYMGRIHLVYSQLQAGRA